MNTHWLFSLAGWCSAAAVTFGVAGFGFTHTPNPGWFSLLLFGIAGIAGAAAAILLLPWLLTGRK